MTVPRDRAAVLLTPREIVDTRDLVEQDYQSGHLPLFWRERILAMLERFEGAAAPTPAMIELRAAAEEVVREMAYLFERDAQDDATLAANDIKDALAYRRLRAALTAQEPEL